MADFFDPSTLAIPPAAQAIEDRHYAEPRSRPKRKPPVRVPEPVEPANAEEPEEDQPEHRLDLDA